MIDYYIQQYTCENGNISKIIIPKDATEDDLLGIKELFDVILERHFKMREVGESE